jgi:hypothetical protein
VLQESEKNTNAEGEQHFKIIPRLLDLLALPDFAQQFQQGAFGSRDQWTLRALRDGVQSEILGETGIKNPLADISCEETRDVAATPRDVAAPLCWGAGAGRLCKAIRRTATECRGYTTRPARWELKWSATVF